MEKDPLIQTRVRRTHLGVRYDLYINGAYRWTCYTAREIEPILEKLLK